MDNPSSVTGDASADSRLPSRWTLWHYVNEKNKLWEECHHQITNFDTLDGFLSLDEKILPSKIKLGEDYALFRDGIRPSLNHDSNKNGGQWQIRLNNYFRKSDVDKVWLDVSRQLLAEGFNYSEDICGAVVRVRPRGHTIHVWTSNTDERKMISIGKMLKKSLEIPSNVQIHFSLHTKNLQKNGPSYSV